MDVLPLILTEQDVNYLPDSVLKLFAEASTSIIVQKVNEYCTKAEREGSDFSKGIASRLRNAYMFINRVNSYGKTSEARNIAYNLNNLRIEDIRNEVHPDQLNLWLDQINMVLTNKDISDQEHFVNNSAIGELFKECDSYLIETTGKMNSGEMSRIDGIPIIASIEKLKDAVMDNRNLFREAPFSKTKGTVFTRLLSRKEDLILIKEGIEIVIAKQKSGKDARSWRRF